MFEIWRNTESGERYLVVARDGDAFVAAGPLADHEDSRRVLERHSNQHHNTWALLDMRRRPAVYRREYTTDRRGRAVPVSD
jgi:hypothetical protein